MDEPNILNIPAYQRKRSIAARGRKKPSYTLPARPTRPTKVSVRKQAKKSSTRSPRKFSTTVINEIPIKTKYPSEELFPDPLLDMEEIVLPENSDFREMKICGICEGYFDTIDVAIIRLTSPLREGDIIIFEQQDGLFEQKVTSMQINRKPVTLARTGSDIGLKVSMQPKVGTPVYKVI